jgi:hypothetical protein
MSVNGIPFNGGMNAPTGTGALHIVETCGALANQSIGVLNISNGSNIVLAGNISNGSIGVLTLNVAMSIPSANLTGQTAAVSNVLTVTPAALGTYRVDAYLNVISRTLDVVQVSVTYTDETAVSRTITMSGLVAATGIAAITPVMIRAASGVGIVVSTALTTGGGSISYDIGASIQQLN